MNLLYNIETKNGMKVSGCYFVKYEKPIKVGRGNYLVDYVTDSIRCFKNNIEIKDIDLEGCDVLKIYDEESGLDLTGQFAKSYYGACLMLGYIPTFPLVREIVRIF